MRGQLGFGQTVHVSASEDLMLADESGFNSHWKLPNPFIKIINDLDLD